MLTVVRVEWNCNVVPTYLNCLSGFFSTVHTKYLVIFIWNFQIVIPANKVLFFVISTITYYMFLFSINVKVIVHKMDWNTYNRRSPRCDAVAYLHDRRPSWTSKSSKDIFNAKPSGMGTKWKKSKLFGYLSGYPGLFSELLVIERRPIKTNTYF